MPTSRKVTRTRLGFSFLNLLLFLWVATFTPLRAALPASWPTAWEMTAVQDSADDWWQALSIRTVPGVRYHLQKSESLQTEQWSDLETRYGDGGEWICPLFEGDAPAPDTPPGPTIHPPVGHNTVRAVTLVIEKNLSGEILLSWISLDDGTHRRMILSGVTLDPIWEDFDAAYIYPHGNFFFGLSPRLGGPVNFTGTAPSLGPIDTSMIAGFAAALPAITNNITQSVITAAAQSALPPATGNRAFYRVAADWGVDSDSDGRFDWQELIFDGNNPFAADSDGDGNQDTAQNQSTEEPTLEGESGQGAEEEPPLATIECQRVHAVRTAFFKPNWPGRELEVYGYLEGVQLPENLKNQSTFAGFATAVENLPLDESGWESLLTSFYRFKHRKTEPQDGPTGSQLDGSHTETFELWHNAYRLRLNKAAPEGGYRIPLKVLRYAFPIVEGQPPQLDGPFSEIGSEEILLEVEEGQTVGSPAFLTHPAIAANQEIHRRAIMIQMRNENFEQKPDFLYKDFTAEGACVLPEDGIEADVVGYTSSTNQIQIKWQRLRLGGDGSIGPPEDITPLPSLEELNQSGLPADLNSRPFAYFRIASPGIYRFQAEFGFPNGTKVSVPYLRMKHAKGRFNSREPRIPNQRVEAGQPDYIGVCPNELSYRLRREAMRWIGRTDYRKKPLCQFVLDGYIPGILPIRTNAICSSRTWRIAWGPRLPISFVTRTKASQRGYRFLSYPPLRSRVKTGTSNQESMWTWMLPVGPTRAHPQILRQG
jgi:hypothetical protein